MSRCGAPKTAFVSPIRGAATGPINDPDPAVSCTASSVDQFACDCIAESGAMATLFRSTEGCF